MTEAPQALPDGWKLDHLQVSEPGIVCVGNRDGDGNFYAIATIDTENYDQPDAALPIARAIIDALALIAQQQRNLNAALADAERYRHLRDHSNDCALCAVNIRDWSEEFEGQAMLEMLEGTYLDDAIDTARAALAPGAAGSTTKDTK